jgi:hypothetical protein
MEASGMPEAYLAAYYKQYGIAYSQISSVLAGYNSWAEDDGGGKLIDGKTIEKYEVSASNYAGIKSLADEMKAVGTSTTQILSMLQKAYAKGDLNTNDYMKLFNMYRG